MMLKSFTCLLLLAAVACSHAGVIINGTRVIFREVDREAVVQLRNAGNAPVLVQTWIDDGDMRKEVESLHVPFILSPPVARMDPALGQAIRVMQTRGSVGPQDRESLFWFNVLEVPQLPVPSKDGTGNVLQFSFHSRIKFFYRPVGLKTSLEDALKGLSFSLGRAAHGGPVVVVTNASPYHVTFRSITLRQRPEGPPLAEFAAEGERMVAPLDELTLSLRWISPGAASKKDVHVFFTAINDQGGDSREHRSPLEDTTRD